MKEENEVKNVKFKPLPCKFTNICLHQSEKELERWWLCKKSHKKWSRCHSSRLTRDRTVLWLTLESIDPFSYFVYLNYNSCKKTMNQRDIDFCGCNTVLHCVVLFWTWTRFRQNFWFSEHSFISLDVWRHILLPFVFWLLSHFLLSFLCICNFASSLLSSQMTTTELCWKPCQEFQTLTTSMLHTLMWVHTCQFLSLTHLLASSILKNLSLVIIEFERNIYLYSHL